MRRLALLALAVSVGIACERERIEVGETIVEGAGTPSTDAGGSVPSFPIPDVANVPDAQPISDGGCGAAAPPISACAPCPRGYRVVDGAATCECCQ